MRRLLPVLVLALLLAACGRGGGDTATEAPVQVPGGASPAPGAPTDAADDDPAGATAAPPADQPAAGGADDLPTGCEVLGEGLGTYDLGGAGQALVTTEPDDDDDDDLDDVRLEVRPADGWTVEDDGDDDDEAVLRHADGTRVMVEADEDDDRVRVEVCVRR